jgi:hypothetical protein
MKNKNYIIGLELLLIALSVFTLVQEGNITNLVILIAVIFLVLNKIVVRFIGGFWLRISRFLSSFISPIILGVVYIVVMPFSKVLKLFTRESKFIGFIDSTQEIDFTKPW